MYSTAINQNNITFIKTNLNALHLETILRVQKKKKFPVGYIYFFSIEQSCIFIASDISLF